MANPVWTLVQFPNLPEASDPALREAIQFLFKGLKDHADAFTSLKSQLTAVQTTASTASKTTTVAGVTAGGTGTQALATNGVLVGQGASPIQAVSPGPAGYEFVSSGVGLNPGFQSPLISELLVDQTGTPILAETDAGVYDIIMVVHRL